MATKKLSKVPTVTVLNASDGIILSVPTIDGGIAQIKLNHLLSLVKTSSRNLALGTLGTQEGSGEKYWVRRYTLAKQPMLGKTYSLSFKNMILPNNNGYGVNIYLWAGNWETTIIIKTGFQGGDGSFSFTIDRPVSADNFRLAFYRDDNPEFSIEEVMLVESNIASEWLPAPEDIL